MLVLLREIAGVYYFGLGGATPWRPYTPANRRISTAPLWTGCTSERFPATRPRGELRAHHAARRRRHAQPRLPAAVLSRACVDHRCERPALSSPALSVPAAWRQRAG